MKCFETVGLRVLDDPESRRVEGGGGPVPTGPLFFAVALVAQTIVNTLTNSNGDSQQDESDESSNDSENENDTEE